MKKTKKLIHGYHRKVGRNNRGVITCRHHQRGHKKRYRRVEFNRKRFYLLEKEGTVKDIEYDPNRNVNIASVYYEQSHVSEDYTVGSSSLNEQYILCPFGLNRGDKIIASENAPNTLGNALPLKNIPLGFTVHNIELTPGKGGQLARAAGTGAKVIAKEGKYVTLRLPSDEVRLVLQTCWATIGQLGNRDAMTKERGKAGRQRWLGRRPHVRGVAKNPVDHPHGGGEGRASIGKSKPLTPWGKPTLGVKSRKPKKYSNQYIIRRRV